MHHLARRMTKLCEGREQDNVGWEGVPVYDSSGGGGGKLPFIVVCRGGDLHFTFSWINYSQDTNRIPTQLNE